MSENSEKKPSRDGRSGRKTQAETGRMLEDLRGLSHRIRRSEKAYERMAGKRRG